MVHLHSHLKVNCLFLQLFMILFSNPIKHLILLLIVKEYLVYVALRYYYLYSLQFEFIIYLQFI